ncbi:MAG: GMC family oxidoreductase [Deltaproteobacteria bacterium]|nr:GMC family oxidoreductase [Deltaproteobacteria bacterium]
MIFDAASLGRDLSLETDLVVVGSGAGGMTAAMAAAEKGVQTLVLEGGEYLLPADMSQREEQMFARLFQESGARTTTDRAVKIFQGRGVGGSTLHNINLCKRIPAGIRAHWQKVHGLAKLPAATWDALYDEVEKLIAVAPIAPEARSAHNRMLERGVAALGWQGGALSHNRTGCMSSGFCEVGCRYNAKNNAMKVMLPRAIAAGAQLLSNCVAVRVLHEGGAARGVEAVALDPTTRQPLHRVTVRAKRVCLAASATGTAALLLRSGVPDPSGVTGTTLRVHPALIAAGDFDEELRAWEGIPQSYECTEHLQLDDPEDKDAHRAWVLTAFAHPVATATMVPGHGAAHRRLMERYAHLGVLTAMIHDRTSGRVRPDGDFGVKLDYWPDEGDRRELSLGLWSCVKLLFAAGARSVVVPTREPRALTAADDLEPLKTLPIEKGEIDVTAVHPMSTVPMGDDPKRAPVGSDGKHHHLQNLWVADASLFPGSIGVPPQVSVYAMGLHVGRALAS